MEKDKLNYVVVTGIIVQDDKFLIVKRSLEEKAFPGLWTVPGGKLRKSEYLNIPKDTSDSWYNVLEKLLVREVKEETGLQIKNIRYLLNLAYIRSDGFPTVIISLYCDWASGKVRLSKELTEYAWITAEGLKSYKFVPGLREEIEMVNKILKGQKIEVWSGKYDSPQNGSKRDGSGNKS